MRIRGLGVIADAVLELHPGLTVVTGETGAGKTMVVTGLGLLLGSRADAGAVRAGSSGALVEGRVVVDPDGPVAQAARDAGAELDDDVLLVARSVSGTGRSRAHVGGRAVPVGVLGTLAAELVTVHGQSDQLRLLQPARQRQALDRFAGHAGLVAEVETRHAELREVEQRLREVVTRRRERAQEADLLRHGLTEIEAVNPQPDEDRELTEEARRLAAADDLREAAGTARAAIAGGDAMDDAAPAAVALVGEARHRLAASGDGALAALDTVLGDVLAQLDDVAGELTIYLDRLDADPERLAHVLGRQAELKALTRKYAADIDGVLAWAQQARKRLEHLDTSDDALSALAARRDALAAELAGHAAAVTRARIAAAERLADGTTAELGGLAMPDARLLVAVTPRPAGPGAPDALIVGDTSLAAGADGVDEVELRLVAHPGATPQPVHKGASGGELSRVMLALEVALAGADPVPTMVFDEVDSGVGGRAAVEIGRRLARLAARHQVVVVTHLPQVAAYADRHLLVDKARAGDGPARSRVRTLDEGERVGELARMLAGLDETDTGRAHAEELLAAARAHRDADRRTDAADDGAIGGRTGRRSRRGTAPVPA